MIELYAKGTTNFARNGIRLHPTESTVTFRDNGQFDLEFVVPAGEGYTDFDYGQFVEATVPEQDLAAITLGTVSYYTVSNENGTPLYSDTPKWVPVAYSAWQGYSQTGGQHQYSVGDKVSYNGKNYECNTWDESSQQCAAPPDNNGWWTEIASGYNNPGKVVETLAAGASLMKIDDFGTDYIQAQTTGGKTGFVKAEDVTSTGESGSRTVAARTIRVQRFIITEIRKEQEGSVIRVAAEHVSYQLGRVVLGECNVVDVTPATAMMLIAGAMREDYSGHLYTNMESPTLTADWSWRNAQSAVMDPKAGLLAVSGARMIRDNYDVFILAESNEGPKYSIRYGANMKSVKWTGNVDAMVTRVYPTAQTEDGRTLMLPEEHIDSVRTVPFMRPEVISTGLKVGQKVKQSDGTEVELTEDEVYGRMRTIARNRFTIDKCDMADVSLEVDWQHMPDTVEYAQYTELKNAAPGDMVEVVNGPLGISMSIRMSGYTWDPMAEQYKSAIFGDIKTRPTVAGYAIKNGSITASAIAPNSITGDHIQADTITAREIEAHSITAYEIASHSITADEIMAETITADEIAAGTITAEKIGAGEITTVLLAAESITSDKIATNAITAGHVAADAITSEAIQAGAILATKIASGAITTEKLDAYAVTADKLAASSVTAGKIAANAITANAISTTDIDAINAKLGTAQIASAQIAVADINYAQVKDLNAGSAFFGQTVIQEGLANKLYIPRLSVGYAQMIGATIGDLVIQASNGNYYGIDVDLSGNITATQRTVTAGEIAAGHTTDGRTLVLGTDILATDLNTQNIYASHSLMDQITASLINVDQLFAREATIAKINATDLSSNTYIQATIGNWQSGSTITQTINSLNTRISELGYGTIYYSATEPSHDNLVQGDIWVQPLSDHIWEDLSSQDWQDILGGGSWGSALGAYNIYTWTGQYFKLIFDSTLNLEMWTAIEQNSQAIALKASQTDLDIVTDTVSEYGATLEVQAREISAAVSSVNAKASVYVQWTDPTLAHTVTLGDIWIKAQEDFGRWLETKNATWRTLKDNYKWKDALGGETYVWDGTKWRMTSDRATEIYQKTLIDQNGKQITLLAETSAQLGDELIEQRASITITAAAIAQEVTRATSAEAQKINKTTRLQTADDIVQEAVEQSVDYAEGETGYIKKTEIYQSAEEIKTRAVNAAHTDAANTFIAQTSTIQTAERLISEAVRQAGVAAEGIYVSRTTLDQTADQILASAEGYADEHFYWMYSGIEIKPAGIEISGGKYVQIKTGGIFTVASGNFSIDASGNVFLTGTITAKAGKIGSWIIGESWLYTGSRSNCVVLVGGEQGQTSWADWNKVKDYAMYAGADWPVDGSDFAPFRVKKDGTVYLTKIAALDANGNETIFNLRTIGLWKLGFATIRNVTVEDGYCTSMTFSNNIGGLPSVNFKSAASVTLTDSGWVSGGTRTITASNGRYVRVTLPSFQTSGGTSFSNHKTTVHFSTQSVPAALASVEVDATSEYNTGYSNGYGAVTLSIGGWQGGSVSITTSNGRSGRVTLPSFQTSGGTSFSNHKTTVYFSTQSVSGALASKEVDATSEYNAGHSAGYSAGWAACYDAIYRDGNVIYGPGREADSEASEWYRITAYADEYRWTNNAAYYFTAETYGRAYINNTLVHSSYRNGTVHTAPNGGFASNS